MRASQANVLFSFLPAPSLAFGEVFLRRFSLCSLGLSLTDTLDDLINEGRIEPQLAMKILSNYDRFVTEILAVHVRARLTFKVYFHHLFLCDLENRIKDSHQIVRLL